MFADLRAAIDAYLAANPGVKKVYVTGHSLGGAMAHAFMQQHAGDARYEAATFGSLGFGVGPDANDPRIINLLNEADIVRGLTDRSNGDDNLLANGFTESVASHLMDLYGAEARFLRRNGIDFDQLKAAPDVDSFVFKAVWNGAAYVIGEGNDALIGTPGADFLIGGNGADTLNGGAGNDVTNGGAGNDIHRVAQAADKVVEFANRGTDTVLAAVSYALATNVSVEILRASDAAAKTALTLTGNNLGNKMVGNAGANVINGGGGSDTLHGLGGRDIFLFDTAPHASANRDTIADFSVPLDTIQAREQGLQGTRQHDRYARAGKILQWRSRPRCRRPHRLQQRDRRADGTTPTALREAAPSSLLSLHRARSQQSRYRCGVTALSGIPGRGQVE